MQNTPVLAGEFFVQDTTQITSPKSTGKPVKKGESLMEKLVKKLSKVKKEIEKKKAKISSEGKAILQVYGWHPFWLGDAYISYNYNLLTTLSYFSIEAKYAHGYIVYDNHNWGDASSYSMVRSAKLDGCRIDLTFKCQDPQAIQGILNDNMERDLCIHELMYYANSVNGVNGITVVFEDIPDGNEVSLTNFIKLLSDTVTRSKRTLTLALPAEDFSNRYQLKELNKYVHQFILMGYNYHYSKSAPGPVAPLESGVKWSPFNVKRSVKKYVESGIPENKLILALPYYSAVWEVDTSDNGTASHKFHDHWRYNRLMKELKKHKGKILYDSTAHTNYYFFNDNGKEYVCFFDDVRSLKHKYNWVAKEGLAGIGIWALGYDDKRPELWKLIDEKISVVKLSPSMHDTTAISDSTAIAGNTDTTATDKPGGDTGTSGTGDDTAGGGGDKKPEAPPTTASRMLAILKHPQVLITVVLTLALFAFIGALTSLTYESVRQKILISNLTQYGTSLAVLVLFYFSIYSVLNFLDGNLSHHFNSHLARDILVAFFVFGLMLIHVLSYKLFLRLLRREKLP